MPHAFFSVYLPYVVQDANLFPPIDRYIANQDGTLCCENNCGKQTMMELVNAAEEDVNFDEEDVVFDETEAAN